MNTKFGLECGGAKNIHPVYSDIIYGSSLIKSEEKKTAHFLSFIAHQISILAVKWITQSQNKMFKALIWGIVHFCRSNITRDMIKILKRCFSKNSFSLSISAKNAKIDIFWKNSFSVFSSYLRSYLS